MSEKNKEVVTSDAQTKQVEQTEKVTANPNQTKGKIIQVDVEAAKAKTQELKAKAVETINKENLQNLKNKASEQMKRENLEQMVKEVKNSNWKKNYELWIGAISLIIGAIIYFVARNKLTTDENIMRNLGSMLSGDGFVSVTQLIIGIFFATIGSMMLVSGVITLFTKVTGGFLLKGISIISVAIACWKMNDTYAHPVQSSVDSLFSGSSDVVNGDLSSGAWIFFVIAVILYIAGIVVAINKNKKSNQQQEIAQG